MNISIVNRGDLKVIKTFRSLSPVRKLAAERLHSYL